MSPQRSGQGDAALEREIASALAVDPSPEFLARVRARVADEAQSDRGSVYGGLWLRRWGFLGLGLAAAAVIVMMVVAPDRDAPTTVSEHVVAPPSPVVAAPLRPETVSATPVPTAPRARRPRVAAPKRSEPEVLIAADEAAAIRRLIVGVNQGLVDMPELTTPAPDAAPLSPASMIAIQPVIIEPLTSSAGEQGVRQ